MLQQLADDRRDVAGFRSRPDGLQIAAGAEGAALAFDDKHADVGIGLNRCAERLELLWRSTDRSS